MQYRKNRTGEDISVLGYGCMRFTKTGGRTDLDKATAEIRLAYESGVNYYDTAYVYPGNEEALGEILARLGIRKHINLATKLPQYLVRDISQADRYFSEEKKRLRTDYIDYYLMHMMTDYSQWEHLCSIGIGDWIAQKKASGEIRNIGFSFHGSTEIFLRILDAYPWDFCQIQYNYMDEETQAGRRGLEAAAAKGIPVIIMEPLRGGKLVNLLPEKARTLIREKGHGWTPAELGLRWLWDQPGVTCVLSGMNSEAMIRENCRIADEAQAGSFTPEDFALIRDVKDAIAGTLKIGCTGCRYCMPCPKGVDIPALFLAWNEMYTEGKHAARFRYAQVNGIRKDPVFATQCIRCGRCEKLCPQHLPIRDALVEADRAVRPLAYRIGTAVARQILLKK